MWVISTTLQAIVFYNASRRVVLELNSKRPLLEETDVLGSRRKVWLRSKLADFRVHSWRNNPLALSQPTQLQAQVESRIPAALLTLLGLGRISQSGRAGMDRHDAEK